MAGQGSRARRLSNLSDISDLTSRELLEKADNELSAAQTTITNLQRAGDHKNAGEIETRTQKLKARRDELKAALKQQASTIAKTYSNELNLLETMANHPMFDNSERMKEMRAQFFTEYNQQQANANPEQIAEVKAKFAERYKETFGHRYDGYLPTIMQERIDLSHFLGEQKSHATQSLWRVGASVTAFQLQDPDPNAVDHGALLGIQFEIMRHGQFTQAYRIFFNRQLGKHGLDRPFTIRGSMADEGSYLRIHRHTIPGSAGGINIATLAERYLPPPTVITVHPGYGRLLRLEQDLAGFVQEIRQRLVAYHNRLARIADARRDHGLTKGKGKQPERQPNNKRKQPETKISAEDEHRPKRHAASPSKPSSSTNDEVDKANDMISKRIVNMRVTDAEAKLVEVTFNDDETISMVLNDHGEVEKILGDKLAPNEMTMYRQFCKEYKTPKDLREAMRDSVRFCNEFVSRVEQGRRDRRG